MNVVGGTLGPGTGFKYTHEYAMQVGGVYEPITVALNELQNLNQILPDGIITLFTPFHLSLPSFCREIHGTVHFYIKYSLKKSTP